MAITSGLVATLESKVAGTASEFGIIMCISPTYYKQAFKVESEANF